MAVKRDVIDRIARRHKFLRPEDAKFVVEFVLEQIENALLENNRVEIRGFGSFSVRQRKFCNSDEKYNTVYYRMSKNIQNLLNKSSR